MSAVPFDQVARYGVPIISSIATPLQRLGGRMTKAAYKKLRAEAKKGSKWAAETLAGLVETIPEDISYIGNLKRLARYGRADILDYEQRGNKLVRRTSEGPDIVEPYGYVTRGDEDTGFSFENKITKKRVSIPNSGWSDPTVPGDPNFIRTMRDAAEVVKERSRRGGHEGTGLRPREGMTEPDPRLPSSAPLMYNHGEPVKVRVYRASVMGGSIPGRATFYSSNPEIAWNQYLREQRRSAEKFHRGKESDRRAWNPDTKRFELTHGKPFTESPAHLRMEGRPERQVQGLPPDQANAWRQLPAYDTNPMYRGTTGSTSSDVIFQSPYYTTGDFTKHEVLDARARASVKDDLLKLGDTQEIPRSGHRPIHEDLMRHVEQRDLEFKRPFVPTGSFDVAGEPADLFVTMSDRYSEVMEDARYGKWTPEKFQEEVRKRADPWGLIDGKKFTWKDVRRLDERAREYRSLKSTGGVYRYADKLFVRMMREHGYDGAIFPSSQYLMHLGEATDLARGVNKGMKTLSEAEKAVAKGAK